MRYDDLLGIPFREHGRDRNGYDCYGLVLECCRRAGTPLKDLCREVREVPADKISDYINDGINLKKTDAPKAGAIAFFMQNGNSHVGYIVSRDRVLHATKDHGVLLSPLMALQPIAFYEVTDESNSI